MIKFNNNLIFYFNTLKCNILKKKTNEFEFYKILKLNGKDISSRFYLFIMFLIVEIYIVCHWNNLWNGNENFQFIKYFLKQFRFIIFV
jgi:hypothetical protein